MTVRLILQTKGSDVFTLKPDASLSQAVNMLAQKRIGALIISTDGAIIEGILSERDIVRAVATGGAAALSQPASSAMTTNVVTCGKDDTVAELMAKMTAGKFRHLPVSDQGRLAGMVSIGDIVKARLAEMEHESTMMRQYIAGE